MTAKLEHDIGGIHKDEISSLLLRRHLSRMTMLQINFVW